MNNSTTVDPSHWDEVGPLLDGGILRPYEELKRMPYYAPPGFYASENVLAFQPGWDGQDGEGAVHWYGPGRPTVAEVREKIASLLLSSWLVQDRPDAGRFFLGDEPGSIATPYGTVPARVVFAPRKGNDAPWENLNAVLADVDAALEAGARPTGGFVDWRLRNAIRAESIKIKFSRNPDGALAVVFRSRGNDYDVPVFLWGADGSPRGGEVQEYEPGGAVGLYESYPLRNEADLEAFLACLTARPGANEKRKNHERLHRERRVRRLARTQLARHPRRDPDGSAPGFERGTGSHLEDQGPGRGSGHGRVLRPGRRRNP